MATRTSRLGYEEICELRGLLQSARGECLAEYAEDIERERALPAEEPGDLLDRVEAAAEREELFAVAEDDFERLREIDDALLRLDEGSYGVCQTGGEPIPVERLRALPWARHCAVHQDEVEARKLRVGRRRTLYPASPPSLAR